MCVLSVYKMCIVVDPESYVYMIGAAVSYIDRVDWIGWIDTIL